MQNKTKERPHKIFLYFYSRVRKMNLALARASDVMVITILTSPPYATISGSGPRSLRSFTYSFGLCCCTCFPGSMVGMGGSNFLC